VLYFTILFFWLINFPITLTILHTHFLSVSLFNLSVWLPFNGNWTGWLWKLYYIFNNRNLKPHRHTTINEWMI
jgi:hypothetical protein